ncbi:MAG: radical SAM protein [Deltaproteobacteria bacterium]|nr:radical SAM protein [Deltaproteobacteria bacterium]
MLWHHPDFIKPYLRLAYRLKVGTPLERRLRNGYAALPARIEVNLTRRCNLKCLMCIQHRHSSDIQDEPPWYDAGRELSIEAWTELLDQAAEFRPWITISGGEPMLYPRFDDFVLAARERKLPVQINTNGVFLAKKADFLVSSGVGVLSVSVDGPEDVHDRIRGQSGLFRRTIEGLDALLEARRRQDSPSPIVQLFCTISKANLASLEKMVPLAIELKADIMLFQHTVFNTPENVEKHNRLLSADRASAYGLSIIQPSVPNGEYYESEIGPEDVPLLREVLGNTKKQTKGKVKVFMAPHIGLEEIGTYYLDMDYPNAQTCDGLWTTMRVMPDGTFSPCLHVSGGNITERPIKEIWDAPQIRNLRKLVAGRLFPGCARCCHRHF